MKTRLSFLLLALALPLVVGAATLININTADSATLQTLNGIGPSKAQAIIDYRTQNGAFTSIDQITNVSGIGTATYNNIKDFITVSDSPSSNSSDNSSSQNSTSSTTITTTTSSSSGGNAPPEIAARIEAPTLILVGAGSAFSATAYDSAGKPLQGARFIWNFGDGTVGEGAQLLHTYVYPGSYEVVLTAAYNYSGAIVRLSLDAAPAQVALYAEGDGSLTVADVGGRGLYIGLWQIVQGNGLYTVPQDTAVLPGKGVRFAPGVLGFIGSEDARLLYPNRTVAAAAQTSASSPKRGVSVDLTKAQPAGPTPVVVAQDLQPAEEGEVLGSTTENSVFWYSLGGLVLLIALGSAAIYALQPRRARVEEETELTADEFDIQG